MKSALNVTYLLLFLIFLATSCINKKKEKAETLFYTHCSSCHVLPNINSLPKDIWKNNVLPDMAARMGIIDSTNNPFKGISLREKSKILEARVYPTKPLINKNDWNLLEEYIILMAPETLVNSNTYKTYNELKQFKPVPLELDSLKGSLITFLGFDSIQNKITTSDLNGSLITYDPIADLGVTKNITFALTSYIIKDSLQYLTAVGFLDPSNFPRGFLSVELNHQKLDYPQFILHRPVNTIVHDLNGDGNDEVVVCEFGDLTGQLTLFKHNGDYNYSKEDLLKLPGTVRSIAKDMNKDGKDDLVVLTSQGREGISIFYQEDDLKFRRENPIKFSPVYGSSWFDLLDYNDDGYEDIVTVHGDNADKSYVHKPYHGLRLHINDGNNNFEETYFFPMNGATRAVANDFDQDGDIDFAIISTFPDYSNTPSHSFIYLENKNEEEYTFQPFISGANDLGRWLLMDSGDIDNDGDMDIILSSFSYTFTPVPENLKEKWENSYIDLLILENSLIP